MILADLAHTFEALLLEHGKAGIVQEGRGNGTTRDFFRVALHRSATQTRDLLQGAVERCNCDAAPAIALVHEEAGDSPLWRNLEYFAVCALVFDAGQLF